MQYETNTPGKDTEFYLESLVNTVVQPQVWRIEDGSFHGGSDVRFAYEISAHCSRDDHNICRAVVSGEVNDLRCFSTNILGQNP